MKTCLIGFGALTFTSVWPERIPRLFLLTVSLCQVPVYGADGCQPVPGDPDGAGSRAAVLSALPDAVWHQAPSRRGHHTQGRRTNTHALPSLTFLESYPPIPYL